MDPQLVTGDRHRVPAGSTYIIPGGQWQGDIRDLPGVHGLRPHTRTMGGVAGTGRRHGLACMLTLLEPCAGAGGLTRRLHNAERVHTKGT